jgi:seryl-tRNA synthetase
MLDPKFIRDNSEKVKQNILERNFNPEISNVDAWLQIDTQRTEVVKQIEQNNQRKNEIAEMLKDSTKRTPELIEEGKNLKEKLEPLSKQLEELETKWNQVINQIPNMHFDDVPRGKDDTQNKVLREVGTPTKFDFEPKDHLQLGTDLDILDFKTGAKVTGSQFYYLKNEAVLLDLALQKFGMDLFRKKGFDLVITPDMAKSRYYLGTGYAPRGDEAQTYTIEGEDLGLIATAEVTMAGYFADETLIKSELPKKFAAVSHCFRKEAGAYGKYSKGLYRVHQFTKLEMFVYCAAEQSNEIHKELLAIEEEIVQALKIPYRVIEMCTGDLGAMAARKYDIEAWLPSKNDYGEITSTSNCTDYQSRNLNIKYKDTDGQTKFAHLLNGTAIVMSRIPIAIMENYQQSDGSIKIPEVLIPYMGVSEIKRNM